MKKKLPSPQFPKKLPALLYKVIYYIVQFFVFVGEATIFLLFRLPARFIRFVYQKVGLVFHYLRTKAQGIQGRISYDFVMFKPVRYTKKVQKRKKKTAAMLPIVKLPKIKLPKFPKVPRWSPFKYISLKVRYFFFGCLITVFVVLVIQSYFFVQSLPSPKNIGKVNYPLSTHIYDKNGAVLYEIYHDQNRTPITLKELPKYVTQATIAIEDKDFYRHNGISLTSGVFRAIREILLNKSLQGGSTITQQLVKSSLLSPERTFQRKIKEAILAVWAERIFTKEEILQMYLNQVAFGGSSYGIEEAAKVYFNKSARDLNLVESATLAGLPQAPSLYSPYINPDLTLKRRNEVLENMYREKFITLEEKDAAKKTPLGVVPLKTNINAPHFVFYVKSLLESQYGVKQVEEGGMTVKTTLDLDIQRESEKILKEELEKITNLNVSNGAILVTRPSTGEILAMVGSVDYFAQPSGAFNVTTGLRQPGSSIKPLMYSLALEKGFTAATILNDSPVTFNLAGSESYRPVNYDGKFHGAVPLRYALANSYNIPAVRALSAVGVDSFVNHARKMGISTWLDSSKYGLSLTLGGGEVTMLDMAKAFGVFANEGYRTDIAAIKTIENTDNQIIYRYEPSKTKVLNEGAAYIISDILSDNFARRPAFGSSSALEVPGYRVAVKTGTTDWKKDNWTIGYTPDVLVAVWVGNNDGTPMNQYLASGITGAAPIWNRVMSYVLKKENTGNKWFTKPENIIEKNCFYGRPEVFIRGTEGSVPCQAPPSSPSPSQSPAPSARP